MLVELEHMQQTDLLRRRQQVSQMPPQIFQPLYKRQETREDFQREMEFAFEDMYTGERSKDCSVVEYFAVNLFCNKKSPKQVCVTGFQYFWLCLKPCKSF